MCDINSMSRVGGMPWPKTGTTQYHAQLGLPDNQRVGCLLCCMAKIYDLWDGTLDKRRVRGLVPCCVQDGYRAQVPQQPIYQYLILFFVFFFLVISH